MDIRWYWWRVYRQSLVGRTFSFLKVLSFYLANPMNCMVNYKASQWTCLSLTHPLSQSSLCHSIYMRLPFPKLKLQTVSLHIWLSVFLFIGLSDCPLFSNFSVRLIVLFSIFLLFCFLICQFFRSRTVDQKRWSISAYFSWWI